MSTPPNAPPAVAAAADSFPQDTPSLPSAPVLSYLANISTPTRVRVLTARIVMIVALLHLLLALVILVPAVLAVWHDAQLYAMIRASRLIALWRPGLPPLPPPSASITVADVYKALRHRLEQFIPFTLVFTLAMSLFLLTRPIRQGRRIPSILASCYFVPINIFLLLGLGIFVCIKLEYGLGIHGRPEPGQLPWLFVLPPGILLILLLKDLCAFLLWIVRNPMVDRSPVPFMPPARSALPPDTPRLL